MTGGAFDDLHPELRAVARGILGRGDGLESTWSNASRAGHLGLEVPESLDGAGVTFAESGVVLEEIGRAGAPGPYLGTMLGAAAAQTTRPSQGRDRLLREMASGATRVAVVLAPDADGVPGDPADGAAFTVDDGVLHGHADHVVDVADADVVLVVASLGSGRDHRAGRVLVRLDPATVAVEAAEVLDPARSIGRVTAHAVPVAADDLWVFTDGAERAVGQIHDRARVAVALDAMGAASAMVDATVGYVGVRRQFDRPIGSFQAVKHQCADALVQLRLGRELLDLAIRAIVDGVDADERSRAAARAKAFVTDAAVDVVGTAMQLHGGIGYTWESGIHRYLKRVVFDRALFGSPAVQRREIGEHLRLSVAGVPRLG